MRETNSKIVTDHGLKLAIEPKVVLPEDQGAVEGVIEGKSDLSYTVEMEIVPPITLADFKAIKLERLTRRCDAMPRSMKRSNGRRAEPAVRRQDRGRPRKATAS